MNHDSGFIIGIMRKILYDRTLTVKLMYIILIAQFLMGQKIDGQHLRPPVLAILLETIERENFDKFLP